jgi:DNA-binding transcriptional LysR family regulator
VVASPDYLAARGTPLKPADLADHDVIFGTAWPGPHEWRFGGTTIRLAPRLMMNEVTGRLYAARAGRGLTRVLSYQVVEDLAEGRLVRVLRDCEPPPMPVQLVTVSAAHRPPKLRAFLDHAAAALRALPVIHAGPPHP